MVYYHAFVCLAAFVVQVDFSGLHFVFFLCTGVWCHLLACVLLYRRWFLALSVERWHSWPPRISGVCMRSICRWLLVFLLVSKICMAYPLSDFFLAYSHFAHLAVLFICVRYGSLLRFMVGRSFVSVSPGHSMWLCSNLHCRVSCCMWRFSDRPGGLFTCFCVHRVGDIRVCLFAIDIHVAYDL